MGHISMQEINLDKQTPYRNRHSYPSINVMVVVSFDMKFSYVIGGWQSSASDRVVLKWVVTDGGFDGP